MYFWWMILFWNARTSLCCCIWYSPFLFPLLLMLMLMLMLRIYSGKFRVPRQLRQQIGRLSWFFFLPYFNDWYIISNISGTISQDLNQSYCMRCIIRNNIYLIDVLRCRRGWHATVTTYPFKSAIERFSHFILYWHRWHCTFTSSHYRSGAILFFKT